MSLKSKLKHFLVAVGAAFLMVGVSTVSVNAAKGDRGTDQSEYQGQYGRLGYGDETFEFSQVGGYYNGAVAFTPTPTSTVNSADDGKPIKC